MTFEALLDQSLTLHHATSEARDIIGGSTVDSVTTLTVDAYIYPTGGDEDRTNRNTQLGDWRALIPAGTDVTGWDRATWSGRTFDIVAPPEPVRNPRTHTEHHIRLRLEEVV